MRNDKYSDKFLECLALCEGAKARYNGDGLKYFDIAIEYAKENYHGRKNAAETREMLGVFWQMAVEPVVRKSWKSLFASYVCYNMIDLDYKWVEISNSF